MPRLRAPFVFTLAALSACSSSEGEGATPGDDAGVDTRTTAEDTSVERDTNAADATDSGARDATDASDSAIANPAGCPKTDPGFGPFHQACTIADTIRCRYRDDCPLRPADAGTAENVYACHDDGSGSHWTLVSTDYVPVCPTVSPVAASPCPCAPHMQYVACLYGTCEGLDRMYASCEGPEALEDAWRVTPVSCNPPEPDGGLDGDTRD